MRFSNENVQLLCRNFYGRIFTRRVLSSRRECYKDFASRQDSPRDPGEEFFSWRDPGEYRFLGGILAEIRGGDFSREGSRRENGPPRRDPGKRRESWRDPGEITVPILQGNKYQSRRDPGKILAGKQKSRRPKSRRDPARIPPRFSPRRKIPGGQNLCAILPRILPRFSPGSNNPGGQNLAKCYRESRQDSRRGANSRWQKSRRDLAGNLAKIGTAKVAKKAFNVGRSGTQYVAMVTELLSSY